MRAPFFSSFVFVWWLNFFRRPSRYGGILAPRTREGEARRLFSHTTGPRNHNHGASSSSDCVCPSLRCNGNAAHRVQDEGGRYGARGSGAGRHCRSAAIGDRGRYRADRYGLGIRDRDSSAARAAGRPRDTAAPAAAHHRDPPAASPWWLRLLGSRVPPLGRSPLRLDRWPLGSPPRPHLESRTLGAWFAWSRLDGRRLALIETDRPASPALSGVREGSLLDSRETPRRAATAPPCRSRL